MGFVQTLSLAQIAPGRPFHGALVDVTARSPAALHRQDFAEMMLVLSGQGQHLVNGGALPLVEAELVLVRPDDVHTVRAQPGRRLRFINIAFVTTHWETWAAAAGLEQEWAAWQHAPMPPTAALQDARHGEAIVAFQRALTAFVDAPTRLELCRFWASSLPLLRMETASTPALAPGQPQWLTRACRAMQDAENLRGGTARLVALSGVSPAHLARTFRQVTGQTPTAFVNDLRLSRAAMLLASTPDKILVIADDCGFENLSHFNRLFRQKHGMTPQAYRRAARQSVVPSSAPSVRG